jgi:hypothetical protein
MKTSERTFAGDIFADLVNSGLSKEELITKIQSAVDDVNISCSKSSDPRDAGVVCPERIAKDPIKIVDIDLMDNMTGTITIAGAGLRASIQISIEAEDGTNDWVNYTLLEKLPGLGMGDK